MYRAGAFSLGYVYCEGEGSGKDQRREWDGWEVPGYLADHQTRLNQFK